VLRAVHRAGASPEFSHLLFRLLDKNPASRIKWPVRCAYFNKQQSANMRVQNDSAIISAGFAMSGTSAAALPVTQHLCLLSVLMVSQMHQCSKVARPWIVSLAARRVCDQCLYHVNTLFNIKHVSC
jgi:hypothetical protein